MANNYYSNVRWEVFELIPKKNQQKILEIGCGTGATLGKLKNEGYASWTVGIEQNHNCENEASKNNLDLFIGGNIECMDNELSEKFDVILFLDVLEHLIDPWKVLKNTIRMLNNDGIIIVSIPNIRNISILSKLIFQGRWDYQDSGLLDRTHLRFFTDKSFQEQLMGHIPESRIEKIERNYDYMSKKKIWMKYIPFFKDFVTCQIIYKIIFIKSYL